MKTSLFFNHIRKVAGDDLLAYMRRFSALGLDAVELSYKDLCKIGCERMRELTEKSGLCVSAVFVFLELDGGFDREKVMQIMSDTRYLGARFLHIVPAKSETPFDTQAKNVISSLNGICALAKNYGLTVLMEDFGENGYVHSDVSRTLQILDGVPDLRFAFDTGNFLCGDTDPIEVFELFADRLSHVHLKDWRTEGEGNLRLTPSGKTLYPSALWDGCVPLDSVIKKLKNINYNGYVVIEIYDIPDMESGIIYSIEKTKEKIK